MKTLLTAFVAALVGAGSAAGVVYSGIVEAPNDTAPLISQTVDSEDEEASSTDHSGEIAELKRQINALQAEATKPVETVDSGYDASEFAALKATVTGLQSRPEIVVSKVDMGDAEKEAGSGGLNSYVRDVMVEVEAEKKEDRRVDRQQKRMDRLAESKIKVAELIPQFLAKQAERMGLDETQVADASDLMVGHAQARLELLSNSESQKIDDIEVDSEVFKQSLEDLNAVTLSSLSSVVDEQTAKQLLNSSNRMGRGSKSGRQDGIRRFR